MLKIIVWYILIIGLSFIAAGLWGIWDAHERHLDVAIVVAATSRTLTGSVFVMAALGLMSLAKRHRTREIPVRIGTEIVSCAMANNGDVVVPHAESLPRNADYQIEA